MLRATVSQWTGAAVTGNCFFELGSLFALGSCGLRDVFRVARFFAARDLSGFRMAASIVPHSQLG